MDAAVGVLELEEIGERLLHGRIIGRRAALYERGHGERRHRRPDLR
jgi:hypothetical protein